MAADGRIPSRVVDYFAVIQCREAPAFSSEVALRFPLTNHADSDFPKELHLFCFPSGKDIFQRPETVHSEFSFLLTEVDGRRVYVSALRFADENGGGWPCCLALTSHWPFYNQMRHFLRHIRSIITSTRIFNAPLESILTNLVFEVPLPPRGRTEVIVPLLSGSSPTELSFQRPPPNAGALIDFDIGIIFRYLSIDNVLAVFSAVLGEQRILFVSEHETCLNALIEGFCCIIAPFFWRHVYIPLLPISLVEYTCAPMPFIMGVCRCYMPEHSLLNGVVLVDCDANQVSFFDESGHNVMPIRSPPLPERPGKQLIKRLKNLTSLQETNVVCPPSVSIDPNAVKDSFMRFFASILQNFHKCFDADNKGRCFDKDAFLDSSSDRCEFLTQFLNTQAFASFLDERVEFANDIDTLLFDEYLRRERGKPAAFLVDTSQTHKSRYVCLAPVAIGSMSPYFSGIPSAWDPMLIPPPRPIDVLVDATTESQRLAASGMPHASLKFFMDQKVHARQFHVISQYSSRQDQAFQAITKTISDWTTTQRSALGLDAKLRVGSLPPGGESPIADVWGQLADYVESVRIARQAAMAIMERNVNSELSEQVRFIDRELKILFDESKQLDADTTLRKTELERVKSLITDARQRLALIEQETKVIGDSRKAVSLWRQSDLSRLVAARSDVQSLSIEHSEAETAFWTHLDLYNSRIPQIISELQRLNMCRVSALKSSLKALTSSRLQQMRQETAALERLASSVDAIDVDEALCRETAAAMTSSLPSSSPSLNAASISLHRRTATPTPIPSSSPSNLGDGPETRDCSPARSVGLSSLSAIDMSQLFRYSILLWGQFDLVFQHAVLGKALVKQFSLVVNAGANLFEFICRNIEKLFKTGSSIKSTSTARSLSMKMQSPAHRYIIRVSPSESALLERFDASCIETGRLAQEASRKLQQTFVEVRVLKRECKGSFAMIQKRRNKLETDIQNAYETYSKGGGGSSTALSSMGATMRSQREIDVLSRQWEAAQVQHQLGNAHLLDQFQRVEQIRLSSLKRTLISLHSVLGDFYVQQRQALDQLSPLTEEIATESIMSDYVKLFIDETTNKELYDHIGDGLDHVSNQIALMDGLTNVDGVLSTKIRKFSWEINQQDSMPSASSTFAAVSTFFTNWPGIVDQCVFVRRDDVAELRRLRDHWQSRLSSCLAKEQNERRSRDLLITAFERARVELARTSQAVQQNREKLARAESELIQPDSGIKLMKFMKTPIDKQRIRVVESEGELETAQINYSRSEADNTNAGKQFTDMIRLLRASAFEIEQDRIASSTVIIKRFIQHCMQGCDLIIDALCVVQETTCKMDIRADMRSWVEATRSKLQFDCPEVVLRNLDRGLDDAETHHDIVLAEAQFNNYLRPESANPADGNLSSSTSPRRLDTSAEQSLSNENDGGDRTQPTTVVVKHPTNEEIRHVLHTKHSSGMRATEMSNLSSSSEDANPDNKPTEIAEVMNDGEKISENINV